MGYTQYRLSSEQGAACDAGLLTQTVCTVQTTASTMCCTLTCRLPYVFAGKVVDVQRSTTAGFARGQLLLEGGSLRCAGAGGDSSGAGGSSSGAGGLQRQQLRIHFQNENLVAEEAGAEQPGLGGGQWAAAHHAATAAVQGGSGRGGRGGGSSEVCVLATVPDLICCIEEDSEWCRVAIQLPAAPRGLWSWCVQQPKLACTVKQTKRGRLLGDPSNWLHPLPRSLPPCPLQPDSPLPLKKCATACERRWWCCPPIPCSPHRRRWLWWGQPPLGMAGWHTCRWGAMLSLLGSRADCCSKLEVAMGGCTAHGVETRCCYMLAVHPSLPPKPLPACAPFAV